MGNKMWSRSRPTRVMDSKTGDEAKVRRGRGVTIGTLAGIAAIGGLLAWIRQRRR